MHFAVRCKRAHGSAEACTGDIRRTSQAPDTAPTAHVHNAPASWTTLFVCDPATKNETLQPSVSRLQLTHTPAVQVGWTTHRHTGTDSAECHQSEVQVCSRLAQVTSMPHDSGRQLSEGIQVTPSTPSPCTKHTLTFVHELDPASEYLPLEHCAMQRPHKSGPRHSTNSTCTHAPASWTTLSVCDPATRNQTLQPSRPHSPPATHGSLQALTEVQYPEDVHPVYVEYVPAGHCSTNTIR